MPSPLIAIVEDGATIPDMMVECLTSEGYRTLGYRRGAGADDFIARARPDAVILDVRMEQPRAGMAVLRHLRGEAATAAVPVIVCTADHRFVADWQDVLATDHCTVVTKPFRIDDLLAACNAVTGRPTVIR